jgi:TetR/AcrR family transcriptional repressor of mexJK operon
MPRTEPPATSVNQRRVLQAACALFLRNGYRVSMEAVAIEAGVSKQTVYAHFENKDALFHAAVEELAKPLHASLDTGQSSFAATLYALAEAHQSHIMDRRTVSLGRMLIAEAPRFPTAARAFYRSAIENLQQRLALRMNEAMEQGTMRREDPIAAAELFLSMLHGLEADRRLFGVPGRSRKTQDAWAHHAVTIFLKAYAVAPGRAAAGMSGPRAADSIHKNPDKRTESP